jgi:TM2 domain-containing membrane protein YozV
MSKANIINLFMIVGVAFFKPAYSNPIAINTLYLKSDTSQLCTSHNINSLFSKIDSTTRKKIIVSLFAFPFPMGFMGAHRVMLGCKPWIPVVYMATFGGCFGLLPLIDFCVIAFSKDIEQYENNSHVFMWIKD